MDCLTNWSADEVYDLPELYMEIFWHCLHQCFRDHNLAFSEGFSYSNLPHFSVLHVKFKRPPKGKKLSDRQASKITLSKRRRSSKDKPFSEHSDFDDTELLDELAEFAKQLCAMADRILDSSQTRNPDDVLEHEFEKRNYMKGARCWVVIEPKEDAGSRLDRYGTLHLSVQIRTIRPPEEWLLKSKEDRRWWTETPGLDVEPVHHAASEIDDGDLP